MKELAFIFAFAWGAAVMADQGRTGDALTTHLEGAQLTAELKAGFHFNAKAPTVVIVDEKRVEPKSFTPRKIVFRLPSANFATARASLYVCDDAETFCEPRSVELKGAATEKNIAAGKPTPKKSNVNAHGFIEDDLDRAVALATKENKLILADISARWCPGCIRLENEVFDSKAFKTATSKFVKVKLDYDRFENLPLKEKYGIWAIPSLLVLNTQLEEVSRIVDYQPIAVLTAFLDDAKTNPSSLTVLKAKADAGDKTAIEVLGRRLYAAGKHADSVIYLEKLTPAPIELADARVLAAKALAEKDPAKKKDFQKTVRAAIKAEPKSSRSVVWRTALVESLEEKDGERKKIAEEGVAVADDLLAHPEKIAEAMRGDFIGEYAGYEKLLVASERADLASAAGLGKEAELEAMKKVASVGRDLKIPIARKGPALRHLIFLVAAEEYAEAETQARALLKEDPRNPEIQRRLLRILNGQKKFGEAIAVGRKTLPQSYGKNEVWVAQQLAKAYVGNGQKMEAKAFVQNYLNRPDVEWSAMKSEKKDFDELLKTLE